MNHWTRYCLLGIPLILIVVQGCGPSGRSPLGKVTGTVSYKGAPVEEAKIVFHNPKGRSATGWVTDGEIEDVTTYDRVNDGVPVGNLVVTIHRVVDRQELRTKKPGKPSKDAPKPPFPNKYEDPKTSGLSAEINLGKNELTFELTD